MCRRAFGAPGKPLGCQRKGRIAAAGKPDLPASCRAGQKPQNGASGIQREQRDKAGQPVTAGLASCQMPGILGPFILGPFILGTFILGTFILGTFILVC